MRPPFRFPEDLITLQRAWQQTYTELAHAPAGAGTTVLRRRLIILSGNLCSHPYRAASADWRAGGIELRRAARTHTPDPTEREAAA
ncbi:hypothetical protein AB0F11_34045 [Streptomyces sp. NPDC032472]|uniref:hypothetical protein n=1 Tax=Streptomyces sp. NPDC032472 TaxID=3155018 RepID=UPI00340C48A7